MKRAVTIAAAIAALLAPEGLTAGSSEVNVQFAAYGPAVLDILPGETVRWTNVSRRVHTITQDDGLFDSGEVDSGETFSFEFGAPGHYAYHCIIHPSITGEIDVRHVTLDALPPAAVPAGDAVEFSGRTSTSSPVRVQRRADGSGYITVATVSPRRTGDWRVSMTALATGDYRASTSKGTSESRRLRVTDRRVIIRATRGGVHVTVTPAAPYAPVLVQLYQRERFGWWPVTRARLDYLSEADIGIERPAWVRVVLVDTDGWTPLATSRVVHL